MKHHSAPNGEQKTFDRANEDGDDDDDDEDHAEVKNVELPI